MSLIALPLLWECPSDVIYRLNVWVALTLQGFDFERLCYVRACVQRGVFTDDVAESSR